MIPLPLFQKKAPAVISFVCLFALLLLLLLTQNAEAAAHTREEKYTFLDSLSQVVYQADYQSLYQGKINDMKQAYHELSSLEAYYEINDQFLYIPDFPFGDHFLYLYEEGYSKDSTYLLEDGNSSVLLSAVKTVQLSSNCMEFFPLRVQEGRLLTEEDMSSLSNTSSTNILPILVGHEYAGLLHIGDRIKSNYIEKEISLEVVGILDSDSYLMVNGYPLYLDRYIIMPSFLCSEPLDEADEIFQVRHYANKLSGFLPQDEATQIFRVFSDLKSLDIGAFHFTTNNSLPGLYAQVMASINLSAHSLALLLLVVSLLLFPLLLLFLLNTNFQYLTVCHLAGVSIQKLRRRTILSAGILFLPSCILLLGYGKLTGLFLHPSFFCIILLWFLCSIALVFYRLSEPTLLTYLGKDIND